VRYGRAGQSNVAHKKKAPLVGAQGTIQNGAGHQVAIATIGAYITSNESGYYNAFCAFMTTIHGLC
jgi:hypothetical protein